MCEHQLKFISEIYFTRKAKIKRKLYFFPDFNGYFYTKPLNWDFISTFRILTMILFIDFNFKYILCVTIYSHFTSPSIVSTSIRMVYKCLLNKTNFWNSRSTLYAHFYFEHSEAFVHSTLEVSSYATIFTVKCFNVYKGIASNAMLGKHLW